MVLSVMPRLGRQRQANSWGLLKSQPAVLQYFRPQRDPVSKSKAKQNKKGWAVPNETHPKLPLFYGPCFLIPVAACSKVKIFGSLISSVNFTVLGFVMRAMILWEKFFFALYTKKKLSRTGKTIYKIQQLFVKAMTCKTHVLKTSYS